MIKMTRNIFVISGLALALSACGTLFDKDNTPPPSGLVNFTPQARVQTVWDTSSGSGVGKEYLVFTPTISGQTIFTANSNGIVTATDKMTGKIRWEMNTKTSLNSGTATNNNLVFVGTREGDLLALQQLDGQLVWKTHAASEILAPAASTDNVTLVKTIDGTVTGVSTQDGHELWHYQQASPALILRGSSAPQISGGSAVVGFEDGTLSKLSLKQGHLAWQEIIAEPQGTFTIQRMVDIDADPIIVGNRVYAATYQGKVAALDLNSGHQLWSNDISSYSGMASDGRTVFVSDAKSHIWAFDAKTGNTLWQQNKLESRTITGPALVGRYLVVADAEGYVHWLNKTDGSFAARAFVNRSGVLAKPVVDNNIVYVYSRNGLLSAFTLG